MKLKQWALIAEIVGAFAVVISLIYVGVQVRDSTRAVRSAAVNDASVSVQAWYRDIGSNQQASNLFFNSLISAAPLSSEEEFQFLMSAHAVFLGFQNSYLLAQEGALDTASLAGITSAVRAVKDLPGFGRYWQQRRGYLHPGFVEYIEGVMAQPALTESDVYRDALSRTGQ